MSSFRGKAVGSSGLDRAEVLRALAVFADPEHNCELRGLPSGRSRVRPGSDREALADAAAELSDDRGVYFCLGPVSHADDRAARVADVVRRRWLLVDIDPVRPKDANATDEEKAAARAVADAVREFLVGEMGWPAPAEVDSGNGFHLLFRIDLPNDEPSRVLCRDLLHALAERFDTDLATVDRAVHNASRISKLPGTVARKGPHSADRPHRTARLLRVPEPVEAVSAEQLRQAAEALRADAPARPTPPAAPAANGHTGANGTNGHSPFRGAAVADPGRRAYARKAMLDEAAAVAMTPASSHRRNIRLNEAAFKCGTLVGAGLLTEDEVAAALYPAAVSCGLGEEESRRTILSGLEAGRLQPRVVPDRRGGANGAGPAAPDGQAAPPTAERPELITLPELLALDLPEPEWAVPGILSQGLCVLAGKPKLGKSWLALNLAITLAAGGKALGSVRVQPGDVLYLALEDRLRRLQDRSRKILAGLGCAASERLTLSTRWPRMPDGLPHVRDWFGSVVRPVLVVVDVWAKFRPPVRGNGSMYDQDYEHASALKSLADEHGATVLLLHHCKKGAAEDVVDEVSGTLGLAGSADGVLVLSRARGENEADLFLTGRDVEERTLALAFDPQGATWSDRGDAAERTVCRTREAILALFDGGASLRASEVAGQLDAAADTVRKELWRMVRDGVLAKTGQAYSLPDEADVIGFDESRADLPRIVASLDEETT